MIWFVWFGWNLVVFFMYGLDKWKAVHNCWRIRETVLIGAAWLFGGVGAVCAMAAFHHKTGKMKFRVFVPLAVLGNVAAVYMILYFI